MVERSFNDILNVSVDSNETKVFNSTTANILKAVSPDGEIILDSNEAVIPGLIVDTASFALTASYAVFSSTSTSSSFSTTASYAVNSSYKIVTDTTAGTSSNSTSEILLKSLLIPANTFPANSVLTIQWLLSKTGTNDIIFHYLKANTSATLVGATQLAIRSVVAAQRYIPNYRRLAIRVANGTGNGSLIYDPTVGSATSDLNENASPPVTVSIDWTNNVYLLVSGYVVSASDSIQVEYLTINN